MTTNFNFNQKNLTKDWIGLYSLCKREIIRYIVVVQQTLLPPLISSILFMFVFGISVGKNLSSDFGGGSYLAYIIPGLVTLHLISGSFENTSSSLFISRWHNHIQDILMSPLSYLEMVIGLLAGGITRGLIIGVEVYIVSLFFEPISIVEPGWLIYFACLISIIFSCAGLMAALWANNFGMLSIWNIYIITPLIFLGGVFNPISALPNPLSTIAQFNPMHFLVNGMRFGFTGYAESSFAISVILTTLLALFTFAFTVHLFKIGYKLRT